MSFPPAIRRLVLILLTIGSATELIAQSSGRPHAPYTQTVNLFSTQMVLVASPQTANSGSNVAIAATLTQTGGPGTVGPTGSVIFSFTPSNGGSTTTASQAIQNAGATFVFAPPTGTDTVVASYAGDRNYAPTQAQTTVTILAPSSPDFDFTIPTVTVTAGQSFSGTITVQRMNGFSNAIAFANGSLPQGVTLELPKTSVSANTSPSSSVVTQTVDFVLGTQGAIVSTAGALLMFGTFCLRRRRRWHRAAYVLLAIFSAGALTFMVGCVGNRFVQANGTQPGTYTIPITGTSGNLTHTHNLTLIVKGN
jgi:hypothetical protein